MSNPRFRPAPGGAMQLVAPVEVVDYLGRVVLRVGIDSEGAPHLILYRPDGKPAVTLEADTTDLGGRLDVHGATGESGVSVTGGNLLPSGAVDGRAVTVDGGDRGCAAVLYGGAEGWGSVVLHSGEDRYAELRAPGAKMPAVEKE